MKYLIIALIITFTGCWQSAPKPITDEPAACFDKRDCMYRNQDNKDKSVCVDDAKECRAYRRYIYCKEQVKQKLDTFQNCWNLLNSK